MQTRSDEFRAQAAECQELADRSYELIKEQYEELTRQWLFLAEHAKAHEVLSRLRRRGETSISCRRVAADRPLPRCRSRGSSSDPATRPPIGRPRTAKAAHTLE
jgi:hypothetical protein